MLEAMDFNCSNPLCRKQIRLPTPKSRDELATALTKIGWVFGVQPGGMVWILQCGECHTKFPEAVKAWVPDA